jgi:acetyltransferase-like isoleucine patch superfamily enzyme
MKKQDTEKKKFMGPIPLEKEFKGFGALRSVVNRLLHAGARYFPMYPAWRVKLHRIRGVKIGKGVFIGSDVFIDNTYPDSIVIQDYVTIISRSFIIGHSFIPIHLESILAKDAPPRQGVLLKKGSYIGAQSIIMPGVTVGECAIVGAGSVVTADIPDFCAAMGSPARVAYHFKKSDINYDRLS